MFWMIKIPAWGYFVFHGSREEAVKRAREKADWEGSSYHIRELSPEVIVQCVEAVKVFGSYDKMDVEIREFTDKTLRLAFSRLGL